jgi:hypothetical protein
VKKGTEYKRLQTREAPKASKSRDKKKETKKIKQKLRNKSILSFATIDQKERRAPPLL